jgi:hypothetical protein
MNDLHQIIKDYLQLRRSLGFKLKKEGRRLPDFAHYLESHGGSFITIKLALEWATLPTNVSAKWRAGRLGMVRSLAKYARAFDQRTEIPPSDLIPYQNVRPTPYLY